MPCPRTPSPTDPRRRRGPILLALALLVAAGPGVAARAVAAKDTKAVGQARAHYRNGEAAFKAGRYDDAFREWELGYKLSGRPLFLLNMAHADRRRGELRSARALYKRYLLTDPETKLRSEVEAVLAEIDAAIAADDSARQPAAAPPAVPAPLAPPASSDAPAAASSTDASEPGGEAGSEASSKIHSQAVLPASAFVPEQAAGAQLATNPPEPPAGPALYQRWWFWAGAGGLVAAGVVAALLLRGDSYTQAGSLGTLGGPQ